MSVRFLLACDTFPSNPWERDRLPAIRKAIHNWDHSIIDIYEFNSREEAHKIHLTKGVPFFDKNDLDVLNRKFYERILSYGCDILILGTIDNYSWFLLPETVTKLQRDGVYIVGILGDDEFNYQFNRFYVPMFDKVVVYVRRFVQYYNSLIPGCCYYLPNSCHIIERNFEKLNHAKHYKKHDVAIFGAPFGIRPIILNTLVDAGINVSIFGDPKWKKYKELKDFYYGYVASEDFDNTVRQSKIILAFLEDHLTGALHMNTKIWEAARNGQMCISTRYQPLIEDYGFVENEDIVLYNSVDDLIDKVKYYLRNDNERLRVAKNLFQKVSDRFDYEDLYRELFCNLEQDYLRKEQMSDSSSEPSQPFITIIDNSKNGERYEGFNYVRFPRTRSGLDCFIKSYKDEIKTPYVLFTNGGYNYSCYLNRIVNLFPDEFVNGKVGLLALEHKRRHREVRVANINTVLWKKDVFFREYLIKKIKLFSFHKISNYSHTKLRLATSSRKGLSFNSGLFVVLPPSLLKDVVSKTAKRFL